MHETKEEGKLRAYGTRDFAPSVTPVDDEILSTSDPSEKTQEGQGTGFEQTFNFLFLCSLPPSSLSLAALRTAGDLQILSSTESAFLTNCLTCRLSYSNEARSLHFSYLRIAMTRQRAQS